MRIYRSRLTIESDSIDVNELGKDYNTLPIKSIRLYLNDVNRVQAHTAVDKYFDEFEKMVV